MKLILRWLAKAALSALGIVQAQAPTQSATCTPVFADAAHLVMLEDRCTIVIVPAPAPGSVVVYWTSGTLDLNGNVIPWADPLDFKGWTSLSYGGPDVSSIKYNGVAIYTRPLP
jgi:hypothetical protein